MSARIHRHIRILHKAAIACAGAAVLGCCALPSSDAFAVTAAEKQAEADQVWAQVDSLQTNLNKAMDEYERAKGAHDDALKKKDEASAQIKQETARIEQLQAELSKFAAGMYKQGNGSFLDVLLETTSFEQFLTTWDACSAISGKGSALIDDAKQARQKLEEAEASYQKQSERAEKEMDTAEASRLEIEATQNALREQAESLSAEAAELQYQEELAAEAARQAEEARKQREAEIAAAAEQAEKAQAQADAQANGDDGSGDSQDGGSDTNTAESQTIAMGTGYFTHPCPGAGISSEFGYRTFDNSFHMGLDLAASEGTPYYAADSGTVMYATNDGGYNGGAGNWVVISHGNGLVTKYMHSSATYVKPGDYVERGQNIGAVGNTGNSFGAHLHFQVEVNGVAVNPLNYI